MKLSNKIFAFTFVIASVTLALVAVHTVDKIVDMLTAKTVEALGAHVTREARILEAAVRATKSHVLMLASTHAARRGACRRWSGKPNARLWNGSFSACSRPCCTRIRPIPRSA